jgi:hypothetical protein
LIGLRGFNHISIPAEKFGLDVGFIKSPVAMNLVVDDSFLKKAHAKYKKENKSKGK